MVTFTFSNSLIIYEAETKEITAVKEVWKLINYHETWSTFTLNILNNYHWFQKLYQTLEIVFHPISKHLEVVYTAAAARCNISINLTIVAPVRELVFRIIILNFFYNPDFLVFFIFIHYKRNARCV